MLSGNLAFVTGGGSGIGRATCQVMAREGAQVVIVDLHEDMMQETLSLLPGDCHSYYVVDVRNKDKIQSAVDDIIAKYKAPPTIVANCAGILKTSTPLEIKSEDFDRHIAVNTKGPLNVTQVICKELIKRKLPGSVINIGSLITKTKLNADYTDYAASKAALCMLTTFFSSDLGKHNIRCNIVLPGIINTPMASSVNAEDVSNFFMKSDLKRIGQPEEVAEVIAFLASDKSSYVTGAEILVSGGL